MGKTLIVARHELRTMLSRTSYRVMTALIPCAFLLLFIGGAIFAALAGGEFEPQSRTVGYVDQAGIISGHHEQGLTTFEAFPNESAARQAVAAGDVVAAYVIPPNYMESGSISEIVMDEDGLDINGGGNVSALRNFVRANLISDSQNDALTQRILDPVDISNRHHRRQRRSRCERF